MGICMGQSHGSVPNRPAISCDDMRGVCCRQGLAHVGRYRETWLPHLAGQAQEL